MEADKEITSLAKDFYTGGVVKIDTVKGFKLKLHETNPNAPLSPIFLNIRTPDNPKQGPVTPELMRKIGRLLWRYANMVDLKFDAVAGLPHAGTPIAEAFIEAARGDGRNIPHIRLGKKDNPDGRKVEGILDDAGVPRESIVLVIDDLVTAGNTKDEGIDALQLDGGYLVNDVLVAVDRQQGGNEYLAKRGIELHYLLTLIEIVSILQDEARISVEDEEKILAYLGETSPHK